MKFINAQCELCKTWIYAPDLGAFFRRSGKKIREVELNGEAPWVGIFCVCNECMFVMEDVQDKKDRGVL